MTYGKYSAKLNPTVLSSLLFLKNSLVILWGLKGHEGYIRTFKENFVLKLSKVLQIGKKEQSSSIPFTLLPLMLILCKHDALVKTKKLTPSHYYSLSLTWPRQFFHYFPITPLFQVPVHAFTYHASLISSNLWLFLNLSLSLTLGRLGLWTPEKSITEVNTSVKYPLLLIRVNVKAT